MGGKFDEQLGIRIKKYDFTFVFNTLEIELNGSNLTDIIFKSIFLKDVFVF